MTPDLSIADLRRYRACALGLCLSTREVGIAAVTGDSVLTATTLNVRKRSRESGAREIAFADAVTDILDHYAVTRVAFVRGTGFLARMQEGWLTREARQRGLPIESFDHRAVERYFKDGNDRTTLKAFANAIALRFPIVATRAPSGEEIPGSRRVDGLHAQVHRSQRARYLAKMFLAIGAATVVLDRGVESKLPL